MKNFLSLDEFQHAIARAVGNEWNFSGFTEDIYNLLKDVDLRIAIDPNKNLENDVAFVIVDKGIGMYHGEISVQPNGMYFCVNFSKKQENLKVVISKEPSGGFDISSNYEFHEPSTNHNDDFKNFEFINKEIRFEEVLDIQGRVKALNFFSKSPKFDKLAHSNFVVSNQKGNSLSLTIDYKNPDASAVMDYEILDQNNNEALHGKKTCYGDDASIIKGVKFTKKRNYSQNPLNNTIECNVEKWLREKIDISMKFKSTDMQF